MNNNYLFATSPLNKLPKEKLDELLTYVNSNNVAPYQLGVYENKIYISYRSHLSDIYSEKKEEIKQNIINLALKADELDDFFKDNYGCDMSMESKSEEPNLVLQVQQAGNEKEETAAIENVDDHNPTSMADRLKKLKSLSVKFKSFLG